MKTRFTTQRSPAESGAVTFEAAAVIPTTATEGVASARMLAQMQVSDPQPVALHLVMRTGGLPQDFDANVGSASPFGTAPAGIVWGGVVVDYGDMGGSHRVVADFKSGTYQLPACTFVRVSCFLWEAGGVQQTGLPLMMVAALSRAQVTSPKALSATMIGEIAAGASAQARIPGSPGPSYARLFDVWADGWNGDKNGIGTTDAPIIRTNQIAIERDYTTGLFTPPWGPVECAIGQQAFTVYNDGPAAVRVTAKYLLEI